MNGFEPVRRRIVDYTSAGQWSEVYDGPVESCHERALERKCGDFRNLVRDMLTCIRHMDTSDYYWEGCQGCRLFGRDECDFEGRMKKLGVEVDDE